MSSQPKALPPALANILQRGTPKKTKTSTSVNSKASTSVRLPPLVSGADEPNTGASNVTSATSGVKRTASGAAKVFNIKSNYQQACMLAMQHQQYDNSSPKKGFGKIAPIQQAPPAIPRKGPANRISPHLHKSSDDNGPGSTKSKAGSDAPSNKGAKPGNDPMSTKSGKSGGAASTKSLRAPGSTRVLPNARVPSKPKAMSPNGSPNPKASALKLAPKLAKRSDPLGASIPMRSPKGKSPRGRPIGGVNPPPRPPPQPLHAPGGVQALNDKWKAEREQREREKESFLIRMGKLPRKESTPLFGIPPMLSGEFKPELGSAASSPDTIGRRTRPKPTALSPGALMFSPEWPVPDIQKPMSRTPQTIERSSCSSDWLETQDDYLSRRAHTVSDSAIDLPTTTIQELEKIEVERRERALLQDEEQDGRMELEMEQAENFRAIPRWEATARSKLLVWNRFEKIEGDARDVIVSEEGEVRFTLRQLHQQQSAELRTDPGHVVGSSCSDTRVEIGALELRMAVVDFLAYEGPVREQIVAQEHAWRMMANAMFAITTSAHASIMSERVLEVVNTAEAVARRSLGMQQATMFRALEAWHHAVPKVPMDCAQVAAYQKAANHSVEATPPSNTSNMSKAEKKRRLQEELQWKHKGGRPRLPTNPRILQEWERSAIMIQRRVRGWLARLRWRRIRTLWQCQLDEARPTTPLVRYESLNADNSRTASGRSFWPTRPQEWGPESPESSLSPPALALSPGTALSPAAPASPPPPEVETDPETDPETSSYSGYESSFETDLA